MKVTSTGKRVVNFSVAVKNKFGEKEMTDWVPLTWWNPYQNASEWLVKGSAVFAEGRISQRSYENKEGKKVYVTECIVQTCYPFAGKQEPESPRRSAAPAGSAPNWDDLTEEPPF